MNNKYKIVISNKNLYREIELPLDERTLSLGTSIECDYRLHKDIFFEDIKLDFINNNGKWSVMCSDNLYITIGDAKKLLTTMLEHGDSFFVKYKESNNDVFTVNFTVDFDSKKRSFERRIDTKNRSKITIGTRSDDNIILKSEYVFDDQIELLKSNDELTLNIIHASYGVYHNGNKIQNNEIINNGDFIAISDFMFYYKDEGLWTEIADNCNVNGLDYKDYPVKNNYPMFVRNTRVKYNLSSEKIDLLVAPAPPKKPQQNLAMTLLPALAMVALTIVVRGFMSNSSNNSFIIFSVCTMSLGIITSIVTFFSTKKKYRTDCQERIRQYEEYISRKKLEIDKNRAKEKELLDITYKDTDTDISTIKEFSIDLYDRLSGDEDFLCVFIGKGLVKAHRAIDYKKAESFETNDVLAEIPSEITKQYEMIGDCPITINLSKINAVGILGKNEDNYEFLKIMLTDLVSRHHYSEVKLYLLIEEIDRYQWVKKLPHLQNENHTKNVVFDLETRNNVFESLYNELTNRSALKNCDNLTYLVISVKCEWGIKTHPLSQFIANASKLNVSFVFFGEKRNEIPLYCDQIVELKDNKSGMLIDTLNGENVSEFTYKRITDIDMYDICNLLEPIHSEEISLESSLRKSISIFELLHIYAVEDIDLNTNWTTAQVWHTMAAPIGINAKNDIVNLDLHEKYHGPHGLVAGTTGSGKSEILQTYILSAAIMYHPYEVSFVIIDFKGGGMVNQFKDLPHLIGAITNIDGREIDRSLKSIKAELLKRQTLFADANVNHIDKYIKLFKNGQVETPLPHLIIIVDEFAELKAEQPEFMKELISAARIGRSLGVHLILATQKPSGQVNEQIWSNSKFKLCLKVQNKEDSNEVIKSPLAAEIKEPGRAYLQVGNNEIFELLQSGFSGAYEQESSASEQEYVISQVDFSGRRKVVYEKKRTKNKGESRTQLEAIVQYVNDFCRSDNIVKLPNICLSPLMDKICIEDCNIASNDVGIPIGVYDDPDSQYQGQAKININVENYVIIGSSATGKTNLLQVIIRQIANLYSPKQANIYIMDFGAMYLKNFETLGHVGGVVTISEEEKLKNLFKLLVEEIQIRKERFMSIGISSYSSYVDGGYDDIPRVFVLIDNFTAFKELYGDTYEEEFVYLIREGLACGINVILANAQTSGLGYKYMSNFAGKIALHCNDSSEYSTIFERCRMQPKEVAGRALCRINKELYEMQVYLAFDGEKEIQRSNAVKEYIKSVNERYKNIQARKIPEIPNVLTLDYIKYNYNIKRGKYKYPIALDYSTVDVVNIDFESTNELCIIGNDSSKKLSSLASIIHTIEAFLLEDNANLYIIDNVHRKLKYLSEKIYVDDYTVDFSRIGEIIVDIEAKLEERYNNLIQDEVGRSIKMPLQIVIVNSKEAIEYVSNNKPILEKYNKIVKQYQMLGVCFIYSDIEDATIPYGAPELMKRFKESKKAIITTQKLKDFKFCEISSSIVRNMKSLESGDVYMLNGADVSRIKMTEVKQYA